MTRTSRRNHDLSEFEVAGSTRLLPTPEILDALEQDYPIEASIADLVDNSIDAGATKVLIRFLRRGNRLTALCIADNGSGMTSAEIDRAMQFAHRRKYRPDDLGMFGVGLKSASLSQADVLTVVSRASRSASVGRQWTKAGIKVHDWSCNIISQRSAADALAKRWGLIGAISRGTVIRWDRVDDFDRLHSGIDAYIERVMLKIQLHLGLKLHRFLEKKRIAIQIDVEDVSDGQVGPPSSVTATNPFPPKGLEGARGYPKIFQAEVPRLGSLKMRAHIWQKRTKFDGYKLGGGKVAEHQGLYFYRHDRLIQDGGWCGLLGTNEPHMSLARVEVDIPDSLGGYLKVRSNKAGVDAPATFPDCLAKARTAEGVLFRDFLDKAEEVYRRRGPQKARPMLRPGDGIPPDVGIALGRLHVGFSRGAALTTTWGNVQGHDLFRLDQDERLIVLNNRYRPMLLRGVHGGKTDIPLVRTLLYLLLESTAAGDRIGKVESLRLGAIQTALRVALKSERKWATNADH